MTIYNNYYSKQRMLLAQEAADSCMDFLKLWQQLEMLDLDRMKKALKNITVSYKQLKVLAALEFTACRTMSSFAQLLDLNKSTVSVTAAQMLEDGLIEPFNPESGADKRKTFFKASEKGCNVLKALFDNNAETFNSLYSLLKYKQKADFEKGADTLGQTVRSDEILGTAVKKYIGGGNVMQSYEKTACFLIDVMRNVVERCNKRSKSDYEQKFKSITDHQLYVIFCVQVLGLNTVTDLCEFTGASSSTISIAVRRLADKGLAEKTYSNIGDGRKMYVVITEDTKQLFASVEQGIRDRMKEYFMDEYSDADLKKISRGIKYIDRAFDIDSISKNNDFKFRSIVPMYR